MGGKGKVECCAGDPFASVSFPVKSPKWHDLCRKYFGSSSPVSYPARGGRLGDTKRGGQLVSIYCIRRFSFFVRLISCEFHLLFKAQRFERWCRYNPRHREGAVRLSTYPKSSCQHHSFAVHHRCKERIVHLCSLYAPPRDTAMSPRPALSFFFTQSYADDRDSGPRCELCIEQFWTGKEAPLCDGAGLVGSVCAGLGPDHALCLCPRWCKSGSDENANRNLERSHTGSALHSSRSPTGGDRSLWRSASDPRATKSGMH